MVYLSKYRFFKLYVKVLGATYFLYTTDDPGPRSIPISYVFCDISSFHIMSQYALQPFVYPLRQRGSVACILVPTPFRKPCFSPCLSSTPLSRISI